MDPGTQVGQEGLLQAVRHRHHRLLPRRRLVRIRTSRRAEHHQGPYLGLLGADLAIRYRLILRSGG